MVLALGGNAIMSSSRTFDSQYKKVHNVTKEIAKLAVEGHGIVITHGNGPQVGDALIRHEAGRRLVPPLPLFACVAETQGLLGFMIQTSLLNHLGQLGKKINVVSLVSVVRVSPHDPAFRKPTKPVGPAYRKEELGSIIRLEPSITVKETASGVYRRVVASPEPLSVFEVNAVKNLVENGCIVVAAGGGGIPVVAGKKFRFVDAVVDKDLTSERLATGIGASKLVILTDVDGVYVNYRSKNKKLLERIRTSEVRKLLQSGEFEKGSMEPKVTAAVRFAENTGREAVIANLNRITNAVKGTAGTIIYK